MSNVVNADFVLYSRLHKKLADLRSDVMGKYDNLHTRIAALENELLNVQNHTVSHLNAVLQATEAVLEDLKKEVV